MKELFEAFILKLITFLLILTGLSLLIVTGARAEELRLLDPLYFTIEFFDIRNNRDTYLQINDQGGDKFGESNEYWNYGAATKFNLDLVKYADYALYWNNRVHMDATNAAVRHVGWEYELGTRATRYLDVFWYHHSRHILDAARDLPFPLINYYGVRFILIDSNRRK